VTARRLAGANSTSRQRTANLIQDFNFINTDPIEAYNTNIPNIELIKD